MNRLYSLVAILVITAFLAGCGETVNGMIKDTKRIGKGVKTVFVRD
ncbi:MAG: hypothetical protein GF409_01740 [Candidatus Omnitrophica bacterium]|nr:hypothetical protein [Candidatus Omnitrophota bacterium]